MIDKINKRQEIMLEKIELGKIYAFSDFLAFFTEKVSPATLRRDISELSSLGVLERTGERKGTRYKLTASGMIHAPINSHDYCATETDKRVGNTDYNFNLFESLPDELFSKKEVDDFNNATTHFKSKSQNASPVIQKKELERFVIELAWKSSKIEGNTYTLLDTELLLKEGIEAPGHTRDEATMIRNHKAAFQYSLEQKERYKNPTIRLIEDMHRILIGNLGVSFGLRSKRVGITGSTYVPLSVPTQIHEALESLCKVIDRAHSPYTKALLALLGISYIQPFEDGNKRTARLFGNALLLAYDCAPLSYRNVDETRFKESILVFYEKK